MNDPRKFATRLLCGGFAGLLALAGLSSVAGVWGQKLAAGSASSTAAGDTVTLTFRQTFSNDHNDQINGNFKNDRYEKGTLGYSYDPYNTDDKDTTLAREGISKARGGYTQYRDYVEQRDAANQPPAPDPTDPADPTAAPAADGLPTLDELPAELNIFNDFTVTVTRDASGNIKLPGTNLPTLMAAGNATLTVPAGWQLDPETFWFGDPSDTDALESGKLWAYTITGWQLHDSASQTPQPGMHVFQPGDVISADAVSSSSGSNLTLVALWGKCYFIQNPRWEQQYKETNYTVDGKTYTKYEIDSTKGRPVTDRDVSDDNIGNDPMKPVATLDHLYSNVFARDALEMGQFRHSTGGGNYTGYLSGDRFTMRAYDRCVMLTQYLDYVKHDEQRSDNFGNDGEVLYNGSPYIGDTGKRIADDLFLSATFKSLQPKNADGTYTEKTYMIRYRQKNLSNIMRGNFRFDNVELLAVKNNIDHPGYQNNLSQATSLNVAPANQSEMRLESGTGGTASRYLEFTARFVQHSGGAQNSGMAFEMIRSFDHENVVVNGGTFNSMQISWSANSTQGTRRWFIGRNASIKDTVTMGTTTTQDIGPGSGSHLGDYASISDSLLSLYVTGGKIGSADGGGIVGTSATTQGYCTGARHIFVQGSTAGSGGDSEYNPWVKAIYGASGAALFDSVDIHLANCTVGGSVYGGGLSYTATIYGNASVDINNCAISGAVYGGGMFGNLEREAEAAVLVHLGKTPVLKTTGGKATVNIRGSTTVGGDIYGGGKGGTNNVTISNFTSHDVVTASPTGTQLLNGTYIDGWTQTPTGFPAYEEDANRFLTAKGKRLATINAGNLIFYQDSYYSALSLANVWDTDVTVSKTTVKGSIYGGGWAGIVKGNTKVTVTDCAVSGSVFGGGNGAPPTGFNLYSAYTTYSHPKYSATVSGSTVTGFTFTGQSPAVQASSRATAMNWSSDESLLAQDGTYGYDLASKLAYSPYAGSYGRVEGNTAITVNGSSSCQYIYGGGDRGITLGSTNVTVGGSTTVNNQVFGGGNQASVGRGTTVTVGDSAKVSSFLFGGGNNGPVTGDTHITVQGSATLVDDVYGGGNNGNVTGNTTVLITGSAQTKDGLFGGGRIGNVSGNTSLTINGNVRAVSTNETGTNGNEVFGGGMQGEVGGNASVTISGSANVALGVFGGGFQGTVEGNTSVTISENAIVDPPGSPDTTTEHNVYGGGMAGNVGGTTTVTINGVGSSKVEGSVYGGAYRADVGSDIRVNFNGGRVTRWIFGGNNLGGAIDGDIHITQTDGSAFSGVLNSAGEYIDSGIFGGGRAADFENDIFIEISGGYCRKLYGGGWEASVGDVEIKLLGSGKADYFHGGGYGPSAAKKADVNGNIDITVNNPQMTGKAGAHFYGGSESFSTVTGNIDIHVFGCQLFSSVMYGGGEGTDTKAGSVNTVNGNITMTLEDCIRPTESKNCATIYGGSRGAAGNDVTVKGNITVNATNVTSDSSIYGGTTAATVQGTIGMNIENSTFLDIYGGCDLAPYAGTPVLRISGEDTSVTRNVYGGSNQADVGGTDVIISGGTFKAPVFGGNNQGGTFGSTSLVIHGGTFNANVFGGGKDATDPSATTQVTLDTTANGSGPITVNGSVFGGGYHGAVGRTKVVLHSTETSPAVNIKTKTVNGSLSGGSVYGGGWGANAQVVKGTEVTVDLYEHFTVKTSQVSANDTSGQSYVEIATQVGTNVIQGNVYGGGDVGQVGQGQILPGQNAAEITTPASVTVTVKNGNIAGSVFGAGNGEPTDENPTYTTDMGTVFGTTQVNIWGGIIGGSVYGGGMQGHLYAPQNAGASQVQISDREEAQGASTKIFIGGSVFGGGDKGPGNTLNPSAPTVVGDTHIEVLGTASTGASIFFKSGGVYGDGNLCMVKGNRTIFMEDFTAKDDGQGLLKTFHSIQRADEVVLRNTDIVLQGALDLVDDSDTSLYSINRVDNLRMENGSTVKLTSVVHYLGALESDVLVDRVFINKGHNGTNHYTGHGGTEPTGSLTETEIANYRADTTTPKNLVCVANGLHLTILQEDSGEYGPVTGLFTLALLKSNPGEGGGFVYADITTSTGDFICETKSGYVYTPVTDTSNLEFKEGTYYIRSSAVGYELVSGNFLEGQTHYIRTESISKTYLDVVDDVGGYTEAVPTYYYWYINGDAISFTTAVNASIGLEETAYPADFFVPQHTPTLYYVLANVTANGVFQNSVYGEEQAYTLVTRSTGLTGNEIALELKMGSTSLGFAQFQDGTWSLVNGDKTMVGYQGNIAKLEENTLTQASHADGPGAMQWILHKSPDVSTAVRGMELTVEIDLFENKDGSRYTAGTGLLALTADMSITRLNPTQVFYRTEGRFLGDAIATNKDLSITKGFTSSVNGAEVYGSSFTVEYHTYYVPKSFPTAEGSSMTWQLSTNQNLYLYAPGTDLFATVNETKGTINHSAGINVHQSGKSSFTYNDGNGNSGAFEVYQDRSNNHLPSGTRITMVDDTGDVRRYYYYVCSGSQTQIDLLDFMLMGTKTTIRAANETPNFMQLYENQGGTRVDENLFFIFDFAQTAWSDPTGEWTCEVVLEHLYSTGAEGDHASDIVDYVNTTETATGDSKYERVCPTAATCTLSGQSTGFDQFTAELNGDLLTVTVEENGTWVNTVYREQQYGLRIALGDGSSTLPVGFYVKYNGKDYHSTVGTNMILVPLLTPGEHTVQLCSDGGTLAEVLSTNGSLHLTLASAPVARHHNRNLVAKIDSVPYSYALPSQTALKVTPKADVNRVFAPGETFEFSYTATGSAENVQVKVYRKDGTDYTAVEWSAVMGGLTQPLLGGNVTAGSSSFSVDANAAPGTYRLEFTYADRTEYVNIIVK